VIEPLVDLKSGCANQAHGHRERFMSRRIVMSRHATTIVLVRHGHVEGIDPMRC